ncbi:MAG: hypothetical protein OEV53_12635 [Nitrospira sp.]|nr:hypothetical protein [Nitrospira sp.]
MDLNLLKRRGLDEWHIAPRGKMLVPGVIYATEDLIHDMDEKVYEQVTNVATLGGTYGHEPHDAEAPGGTAGCLSPRDAPKSSRH